MHTIVLHISQHCTTWVNKQIDLVALQHHSPVVLSGVPQFSVGQEGEALGIVLPLGEERVHHVPLHVDLVISKLEINMSSTHFVLSSRPSPGQRTLPCPF